MRVIIAGSRSITDYGIVVYAIKLSGYEVDVVLSGDARGVDELGGRWGMENGLEVEHYPVTDSDWKEYGRRAGPRRNQLMIEAGADALIAVSRVLLKSRRGCSPGTSDMIRRAKAAGMRVFGWHPDYVYWWRPGNE